MFLTTKTLENIQSKPGSINHIWIYDRSGSMSYDLPKLGEDLIRLSGMLNVNDTLTLSWFSSEGGQFRTILKGFKITGQTDKDKIEKIVKENIRAIGMTCFSEVLHDTVETINELKNQYPDNSFCLVFMTDGHPVVSNYNKEKESIFAALKKLQSLVGESMFIGYNQYYNRDFLSQMASEVGAQLVHADKLVDVTNNIEILIKEGEYSRKVVVDISDNSDVMLVFGKSSGKVVVYPYNKSENRAYVADTEKEVFVVSKDSVPSGFRKLADDTEENLYATAYALATQNKIDECIEWLGKAGDKYLIDKVYNAFTTSELGEAINELHAAVFDKSKRFITGAKKNYLPKRDAFCLLEALEILVEDDNAYFYPNRKEFVYSRTGVKSVQKDGYPKFIKDVNAKSPFANLVWNKELLNLGVLTRINGKIVVPDEGVKLGIANEMNCYQWKNYALIKSGFLNVRKLPCSMSKTTFLALQAGGLVQKNWKWNENEIYVLDLKRIPIINRAIADDYTSAIVMANLAVEEQNLAANMKVLKYFWNKYAPDVVKETTWTAQFNDEQLNYLINTLGMRNDGSYSPPTESGDVEDYYEANTFQIKVKGWSSLPSVDEVLKRVKEGKTLNAPALAMKKAYDTYEPERILEYFDKTMDATKKRMNEVRNKIQRGKFAIVLGRRKFNEFPEMKDVNSIQADDGTVVDFVIGKKKIAY